MYAVQFGETFIVCANKKRAKRYMAAQRPQGVCQVMWLPRHMTSLDRLKQLGARNVTFLDAGRRQRHALCYPDGWRQQTWL